MARARTGPAAKKLSPEAETFIRRLRKRKNPVPYRQIAVQVKDKFGVRISVARVHNIANDPESPGENKFGILTTAEVAEARKMKRKGVSNNHIADGYGVSKDTIARALQPDYLPADS